MEVRFVVDTAHVLRVRLHRWTSLELLTKIEECAKQRSKTNTALNILYCSLLGNQIS
jgi:hypothetical protein